jgi:hypothetical protein
MNKVFPVIPDFARLEVALCFSINLGILSSVLRLFFLVLL